jgi:hypothetical protein
MEWRLQYPVIIHDPPLVKELPFEAVLIRCTSRLVTKKMTLRPGKCAMHLEIPNL